jgi:type I restriction enzyme R subunit
VDALLKAKGWPFKSLVAFSGTVKYNGIEYTESGMNSTPEEKIGEKQTADTFKRDDYRILIVANKFQTGFDQPLLHTMYVDKKLGGVNAVQTLSRLNRTCPTKEETTVLDFANESEEIQKAFGPYYDRTLLSEGTDPNLLYDLQTKLADFHIYTASEINAFAAVWFDPRGTQDKLHGLLAPAVDRYEAAGDEDKQQFRSLLGDFVRLYAFLSQVVTFTDADLEKHYVHGRMLLRKLPVKRDQLPVEIQQNIDVDSYRVQQTSSGRIKLDRGTKELEPITGGNIFQPPPAEIEALSLILKTLNDRFGTDFTDDDKLFIQQLEEKLSGDAALEASVKVNVPENARLTFDHVANDKIQEMIDSNFKFYKQITDDPKFEQFFLGWLFERYSKAEKEAG